MHKAEMQLRCGAMMSGGTIEIESGAGCCSENSKLTECV